MPTNSRLLRLTLLLVFILVAAGTGAQTPEEDRLEKLENELSALKSQLETLAADGQLEDEGARIRELERRLQILAEEVENLKVGEASAVAEQPFQGFGPAASKVYQVQQGVSIGGYGEWIYQNPSNSREDGEASGKSATWDALRAILYFGYKFNDRFVLNTEIEYEHATTGKSGEVSLEFAYLDYLHRDELGIRAGLLLMPMGFINELHEPTTFHGSLRPETERRIIPSTWRENGVGIFGDFGSWTYRTYVVNGLNAGGFSSSGLRGGRQKGSKAKAEDLAWVARLDYTGVPGLTLGLSSYIGDSGQDLAADNGSAVAVGTRILEGHVEWKSHGFEVRGLVARADLDDATELNNALGLAGDRSVGERLEGAYLQLGYDLLSRRSSRQSLVPFVRWEAIDTQAAVPSGFTRNPASDAEILTVGFSYKPIEQVVVKADFQDVSNGSSTGVDQINVALGYIF